VCRAFLKVSTLNVTRGEVGDLVAILRISAGRDKKRSRNSVKLNCPSEPVVVGPLWLTKTNFDRTRIAAVSLRDSGLLESISLKAGLGSTVPEICIGFGRRDWRTPMTATTAPSAVNIKVAIATDRLVLILPLLHGPCSEASTISVVVEQPSHAPGASLLGCANAFCGTAS
jgi:hypothetical protein